MVQGVRFEFDTELSDEALNRSPGELWKQQGVKFHFEDSAGEEIQSVNPRKSPSKSFVMSSSSIQVISLDKCVELYVSNFTTGYTIYFRVRWIFCS